MKKWVCGAAMAVLVVARWTTVGWAASLTATTSLNTNPPIPLAGGQDVRTNGVGIYDFGDRDGNGTSNAVSPAGLDFGALRLHTDNGVSIKMNLNGGPITGATSATALDTHRDVWLSTGSIQIHNVGSIAMGRISTYCNNGANDGEGVYAGSIAIGTALLPAGPIRIGGLATWAGNTAATYGNGGGGDITIYSLGDVLVQDGETPLDIETRGRKQSWGRAGHVTIYHGGTFRANDILAYGLSDNWFGGGSIALTGNSTGPCVIRNCRTCADTGPAGNVTIRGYTSVSVGAIDTHANYFYGDRAGGTVSITNIAGDIAVNGAIDLKEYPSGPVSGILDLQCGGSISVTNLNLSKVRYAVFRAGRPSYVNGVLSGTNGAPATGLSDIGTSLRTPAGTELRFWKKANPLLGGQSMTLANEAGTPGAGGRLRPWPIEGLIVIFR